VRETLEETGVRIRVGEILGICETERPVERLGCDSGQKTIVTRA